MSRDWSFPFLPADETNSGDYFNYYMALFDNYATWRLAFTRHGFGTSEGKIIREINPFPDLQEKLEKLVQGYAPQ
jgi:hypothetical protein